jgi:hypothetical protein
MGRADEEAGADQEHEREGDLDGDERAGEAASRLTGRGCGAQRGCVASGGRAEGWRHAEQKPGQDGGRDGEFEHGEIQTNVEADALGNLRD